MVEMNFPECPICKEKVLIPLSAVVDDMGAVKTFAHWICLECGFYFGTGKTKAYDIATDFTCKILPAVVKQMKDVRAYYQDVAKVGSR